MQHGKITNYNIRFKLLGFGKATYVLLRSKWLAFGKIVSKSVRSKMMGFKSMHWCGKVARIGIGVVVSSFLFVK